MRLLTWVRGSNAATVTVRELALFAGAGGGILGSILLGHRIVCAVEAEPYRREVLLRRQRDGVLPLFPIWDDVRTFDGRPWRGAVDLVSAGFPCRPWSSAARGRNTEESLLEEVLRVCVECQPKWLFLENVSERALPPFGHRARVSAASVGAPHIRGRWWLFADADGNGESNLQEHGEVARSPATQSHPWGQADLAAVLGMDDVLAHRMDRLAALGDGQVPIVAAAAFRLLMERSGADERRREGD